jgi:hypothetical protein
VKFADDLRYTIEESPFSEEIVVNEPDGNVWNITDGYPRTIEFERLSGGAYSFVPYDGSGSVTINGLFDESVEDSYDRKTRRRKPRVVVFGWPRHTPNGTIIEVNGKTYKVTSYEVDANVGIVVWLNLEIKLPSKCIRSTPQGYERVLAGTEGVLRAIA